MKDKRKALIITALVVLALAASWAYLRMARMRDWAQEAAKDLGDCYRMGAQIERASKRPAVAAERERLATEVTGLIESAAKTAQIPVEKIEQILPQSARRVGDTAYKEKPTQVVLKDVSLKQWVEFLHALSCSGTGLEVRMVRVVAPRKEDPTDVWMAEAEVSYLIYDPPRGP